MSALASAIGRANPINSELRTIRADLIRSSLAIDSLSAATSNGYALTNGQWDSMERPNRLQAKAKSSKTFKEGIVTPSISLHPGFQALVRHSKD